MKPHIDSTTFGTITIDGITYDKDVILRKDGTIQKRKKKLSKKHYGTSHIISREEMEYVLEEGINCLIVGSGQYDSVELSPEAQILVGQLKIDLHLSKTPKALQYWNSYEGQAVGLFHITC